MHAFSLTTFNYFEQVAELVASEFFEQGDMERSQLNSEPIVSLKQLTKAHLTNNNNNNNNNNNTFI